MMDQPWFWPVVWAFWIVLGIALEVVALIRKAEGDTLSEQVWGMIDALKKGGRLGQLGLVGFTVGLIGFLGWLVLHFFTRAV